VFISFSKDVVLTVVFVQETQETFIGEHAVWGKTG